MLEAYTTLGYLAACTSRAKLLTLVTGAGLPPPGRPREDRDHARRAVRRPGLARHRRGLERGGVPRARHPVPPVAERFERLEETLQICLQMWRGDEQPVPAASTTSWSGRSTRRRRCPGRTRRSSIGGVG